MAVGIALHTLAAVIWVGGMFFAYLVLRPSAGALEPASDCGAARIRGVSLSEPLKARGVRKTPAKP